MRTKAVKTMDYPLEGLYQLREARKGFSRKFRARKKMKMLFRTYGIFSKFVAIYAFF